MNLPEHITYQYHRINDVDLDQAPHILSETEQAYLTTVSHEKRITEFTAGRIVARQEAASLLGTTPQNINLVVNDDGSLDLAETPFCISLAHTRNGVGVAISQNTPVGIDLESIKPRHKNLYKFILDPSEYHLLDSLSLDRDRIIILCWTLKEATLKGLRTGFRCSPKKIRLDIDSDAQTARIQTPDNEEWAAHYQEFDQAYLTIAYPHRH